MAVPVGSAFLSRYGIFDYAFGGAIIILALAFLVFMQVSTGTGSLKSYDLVVQLKDAGGLKRGSDVRLSGIKVGSVSELSLAPLNRFALVHISVRDDLALPAGSAFSVAFPPLSDPYLSIKPDRGKGVIPRGSLVGQPVKLNPQDAPSAMNRPAGVSVADLANDRR